MLVPREMIIASWQHQLYVSKQARSIAVPEKMCLFQETMTLE